MCVGMKQVEVRVIIVQCLEQDFIVDKHYNTVTLLYIITLAAPSRALQEQTYLTIPESAVPNDGIMLASSPLYLIRPHSWSFGSHFHVIFFMFVLDFLQANLINRPI